MRVNCHLNVLSCGARESDLNKKLVARNLTIEANRPVADLCILMASWLDVAAIDHRSL